jgi:hypothetical protein
VTTNATPPTRRARLWTAARARGIPLPAILTTVGVVVAAFLLGKVVYRLKDVILLILVAAFIALILNPLVVVLQRWKIPRRGWAVAVVTLWALLVFVGLAIAFGYPLANGISHLAQKLPTYVTAAENGRGWLGHLVLRYHVQTWVQKNAPKLVSFGEGLAKPALTLGKGALCCCSCSPSSSWCCSCCSRARRCGKGCWARWPRSGPRGTPGSRTRSTGQSPGTCSATSSPR